jgi:phosphomannomutase/phosphoglucomutase
MKLGRKKDQSDLESQERPRASKGRALLLYFLPTVVVALLLMLGLAFVAQQSIQTAQHSAAEVSAKGVAEALAGQLKEFVEARVGLTRLVLADGRVAKALAAASPEQTNSLATELQGLLPGALQVRILPKDLNEPDLGGAAPMGYAGLDMLRSTIEQGRPSRAEVHQIKSGAPYLALAQPVSAAGDVLGVLFVAWDLRPLTALVGARRSFPGALRWCRVVPMAT